MQAPPETPPPDSSSAAAELYFLVAKLLSKGPFRETGETLRRELVQQKILPKRLDWEGSERDQTFEQLEKQHPSVSDDHLLSVCEALLKTPPNKPKRSLLCSTLFRKLPPKKVNNVLDILLSRSLGRCTSGVGPLQLPAAIYGSLKLQRRTLGHLSAVYCVLFDRTGRYIITGADDLLVKLWSAVDGRLLGTLRGASAEITDMAVDTDNQLIAAGSLDRLVRVWDMQTAAPIAVLQGHSGMITSVHFCPGHSGGLSCLVSTSTDGSVAFWTYSHAHDSSPSFISKPVQYVERIRPGASKMICAAWSPGGTFLAAGSADHHVRVYMMAEIGPKRILETAAHCDAVDSLQWAHSGLRFVSGSKDGSAIMWQLHAMQWRHTKLNMSDTLAGETIDAEESKKLKVTMVAWDCMDNFIITAVSDFTLKVWCSHTGKLIRILRGHNDEVYVLEAHPSHPAVILSAGHDGQIFFWDILKGVALGSFFNNIEGQGHGEVYDAKWCPDGTKIAATDSHGHILLLGLGKGHPLLDKLPRELFFHTDYRPLVWDAQGGVCDEQTGVPPHLMAPPFLVDVEGNPHPPSLQRLVPGREHAAFDQLVPDIGDLMLHDGEIPRSHISYMIEALAMRQIILLNNGDGQIENDGSDEPGRYQPSGSRSTENRPRDVAHSSDSTRQDASFRGETSRPAENSRMVEDPHRLDDDNHSIPPRGAGDGIRNSFGEWQRGDLLVRSSRSLIAPLPIPVAVTRRLYIDGMSQLEMEWYGREMRRRPLMISTSIGAPNERRYPGRRGRSRGGQRTGRKPQPTVGREYDEPPEIASPQQTDSDSSVRITMSDNSGSNSSQTDDNSDDSSSSSSSEYSDWVADHPGVPLEPPKRSKRKPAKQTQPQPGEKKEVEGAPFVSVEIPEAYRPSDWLCSVLPRKAPYHPQMGDECMYFKQGHSRYLDAVIEKNVYKVSSRDKPWEKYSFSDCEAVKVIGIKYVIRPPRLVCLKLALENGTTFTVRYHDMPDVIDFFVLRQMYEIAVDRKWGPGDRFRCMIDDGWWMGAIEGNNNDGSENSNHFLSLHVRWDNGEYEQLSPWDLEPIDESRLPNDVGGWVGVLPSELENLLYRPRSEEWPGGDRDEACLMIARGIDQVMGLAIAEPFVVPVDLNVYPSYAYIVEYPIDLSTIKARFENHFYRRVTSAQFDVRYLATNAEKFNFPHSPIVKQARVITELCLQIIRCPMEVDVQGYYHFLMDSYNSSDSDVPLAKQTTMTKSGNQRGAKNDWYCRCRTVLKGIIAATDSYPFRDPVPIDQLPEYKQIVANPMDLSTVKSRLESGVYRDPAHFAKDVRLIFTNSKLYNTNKRSQIYAMTLRLSTLFEALFNPVMENWKATRRKINTSKGSDDSLSDFDDYPHTQNGYNGVASSSCSNGGPVNGNNKYKSTNFSSQNQNSDSWDSDVPLREAPVYKGKGKGKRTINNTNNNSNVTQMPTRSSKRSAEITPKKEYDNVNASPGISFKYNGKSHKNQDVSSCDDSNDSRHKDDDSGDSYKPSKRMNGVDAFHNNRSSKKRGRKKKKEEKRRRTPKKIRNRRPKAKKRKRHNEESDEGTSSDTSVSVASARSKGRYESDHSFQLRPDSVSDSDDDRPLGSIRQMDQKNGSLSQSTFHSTSRLRQRHMVQSDESMAGPSGYSNRARRTARDSKKPRYNEDSEEDSIAAISKRLRGHQRPRLKPITIQSRMSIHSVIQNARIRPQMNGNEPSTSHLSPGPSSSGMSFQSPSDAFAPEDDEPLSVSSRGRIRRLTAKARNLLRD